MPSKVCSFAYNIKMYIHLLAYLIKLKQCRDIFTYIVPEYNTCIRHEIVECVICIKPYYIY